MTRMPSSRSVAPRRRWRSGRLVWLLVALSGLATPSLAQVLPSFGRDRAGTSGFQFLKITVDPRSAALGETTVASPDNAHALFVNPALAPQLEGIHASLGHARWFADTRVSAAALTVPLGTVALGASLHAFDAGEMPVTTEFAPFGTGETFGFRGLAAGLTFAQRLTDLFSYGVTGRYVRESTAGMSLHSAVFDLGIFYRIGATGAQMAVAIRHFGLDATTSGALERTVIGEPVPLQETDLTSVTPPTTFLLGLRYEALRHQADHRLRVSTQLMRPNDNAEHWNVGLEYTWHQTLTLRTGYRFGIEEAHLPTAGFGLLMPGLGPEVTFDYAFHRLDRLGAVHQVGLSLGL